MNRNKLEGLINTLLLFLYCEGNCCAARVTGLFRYRTTRGAYSPIGDKTLEDIKIKVSLCCD